MASLRQLDPKREFSYQPMPMYRDKDSERSMKLDLNTLCIKRPTETFFILVKNPNLIAWGIELDDLLVVEKASEYFVNDLLVIEQAGEYKFYQFFNEINGEKILFSLDANLPNRRIQDWEDITISGVITNVVHQIRPRFTPVMHEKRYAA